MSLTDTEIDVIADEAAKCTVPLQLLRYVATQLLPSDEVDGLVKLNQTEEGARISATVKALLCELNSKNRSVDFALKLYDVLRWEPEFRARIAPVIKSASARDKAHEGLFGARDLFIRSPDLEKLAIESGPRICLLVGDYGSGRKYGTGFLVGPRTVMTAKHVFDDAIQTIGENAIRDRFVAVFDFELGDLPSMDQLPDDPKLTTVKFDKPWLLAESKSYPDDGLLENPTPAQIAQLRECLDFALVRLAEPVGTQPVKNKGTAARGWFTITDVVASNFDPKTRVIISQHPGGLPRRTDMGQLSRTLLCGSRILHDANSSDGSSGAPCLNTASYVIGMHNAKYRPNGIPQANQAIRIDAIKPEIEPYLGNAALPGRTRPWKVDDPGGVLVPILGRDTLIDWIIYAIDRQSDSLERRDRIYAAYPAERGLDTGISFSAEIVDSTLAGDEAHRVVVLGGPANVLPADPLGVILLLGAELGIPDAVLKTAPARPSEGLPSAADDGDKVERWASHKLPEWFCARAEEHRAAKWERSWVLIDDLAEHPMSAMVSNFVSGLIRADVGQQAVGATARRFQWLFLGTLPPFLVVEDVTCEEIDDSVAAANISKTLKAAYAEKGLEVTPDAVDMSANTLFKTATTIANATGGPVLQVAQQLVALTISERTNSDGGAQ